MKAVDGFLEEHEDQRDDERNLGRGNLRQRLCSGRGSNYQLHRRPTESIGLREAGFASAALEADGIRESEGPEIVAPHVPVFASSA